MYRFILMLSCLIHTTWASETSDIINSIKSSLNFHIVPMGTKMEEHPDDQKIYVDSWITRISPNDFKDAEDFSLYLWSLNHQEFYTERLYLQTQALTSPLATSLQEFITEMYYTAMSMQNRSLQFLFLPHLINLTKDNPPLQKDYQDRYNKLMERKIA